MKVVEFYEYSEKLLAVVTCTAETDILPSVTSRSSRKGVVEN
jgi:hypothetical protein